MTEDSTSINGAPLADELEAGRQLPRLAEAAVPPAARRRARRRGQAAQVTDARAPAGGQSHSEQPPLATSACPVMCSSNAVTLAADGYEVHRPGQRAELCTCVDGL